MRAPAPKPMRKLPEGQFVPHVAHRNVPAPFPIAGEASTSREDALERIAGQDPANFPQAWIVTRDSVEEVRS